jgi:nitrogen fixation NifU-like protein
MDLYSQIFLEHAKNPRNVGKLAKPTCRASMVNTSCGDVTSVELRMENGELKTIKHKTNGCLVSKFSASVLSEKLVGKTPEEVLKITPQDLTKILGVQLTMSRTKCALLPLLAIQRALKN